MAPPPGFADLMAQARAAARQGRHAEALARFEDAAALAPDDPVPRWRSAQAARALGRREAMDRAIGDAERLAAGQPQMLARIGDFHLATGDHAGARRAFAAAALAAPDDPRLLFNRATTAAFAGDFENAERDYDRIAAIDPHFPGLWWNRSELRRQTASRHHLGELAALVDDPNRPIDVRIDAGFALSKELADLGDHAAAWRRLEQANTWRRSTLAYDVAVDVATIDAIIAATPRRDDRAGHASSAPIFVVGLPRSGTTLVERVLGAHSRVYPGGESSCFPSSLTALVRQAAGGALSSRAALIEGARAVEPEALGAAYLRCLEPATIAEPRRTDKLPLNHLYCGWIAAAFPHAHIVHVTRHPLATCHAIYRTPFDQAYPFAYSLTDIADYQIAYHRLMRHWHSIVPGRILDLSYERLVADPRAEIARLLAWCGLAQEPACFNPERGGGEITTASLAQARQPIHTRSVEAWRHHAQRMAPAADRLRAAGLVA